MLEITATRVGALIKMAVACFLVNYSSVINPVFFLGRPSFSQVHKFKITSAAARTEGDGMEREDADKVDSDTNKNGYAGGLLNSTSQECPACVNTSSDCSSYNVESISPRACNIRGLKWRKLLNNVHFSVYRCTENCQMPASLQINQTDSIVSCTK